MSSGQGSPPSRETKPHSNIWIRARCHLWFRLAAHYRYHTHLTAEVPDERDCHRVHGQSRQPPTRCPNRLGAGLAGHRPPKPGQDVSRASQLRHGLSRPINLHRILRMCCRVSHRDSGGRDGLLNGRHKGKIELAQIGVSSGIAYRMNAVIRGKPSSLPDRAAAGT